MLLSIDDTMMEKEDEKFELRSRICDHAAHNGSNYLNGHCMVSILLSFPVMSSGYICYLSVPLGCRLWDRKQAKPEIAAEMVRQAMNIIGTQRQMFLLCDSQCMASRRNAQENAAIQRNMVNVCCRKISGLNHQKPGIGR